MVAMLPAWGRQPLWQYQKTQYKTSLMNGCITSSLLTPNSSSSSSSRRGLRTSLLPSTPGPRLDRAHEVQAPPQRAPFQAARHQVQLPEGARHWAVLSMLPMLPLVRTTLGMETPLPSGSS